MDIFVIHSGADAETVKQRLSVAKREVFNLNTLMLKNNVVFWKHSALRKIKKSQLVVFFVGAESHKSPYIAWEIQKAIKHGKPIITIYLDEENQPHPVLSYKDKFSGEIISYDRRVSIEQFIELVKNYDNGDYKIFNQPIDESNISFLFEQYKMFLQTSETLVERRQTVNNFYISVNSALVALFGAILAFNIDIKYKFVLSCIFAFVGIVLSVSWIKILVSYGDLNASKMKIIRGIEKQLPASLYDTEWQALSDKLNKKKYISFTSNEKRIPKIFIFIYSAILIAVIAMLVISLI